MASKFEEIRKCIKESDITISTRRYTIKLTSVEAFHANTLSIPGSYAKIQRGCLSDFIDSKIERRGVDSKILLLTDTNGSNELLMLRMVDDNSAPFRNSSSRIQSYSLQLLLFETSITEKNALEGAPDRLGWIWDSKKAKQADGKRRMFIKSRKLVFEPPLETISGTYEIPDWVEEEDKKSRERKSALGNHQKKGKKKKQNKKLSKTPTSQQHDVQDKLSSSQAECSSSRDTELEFDNGDIADLVTEDNEDRPTNEEPSNEMASLAEDLEGTNLEEEECPEPEVEKSTTKKSVDMKTLQRERLEVFMMCQICYEYYDDGKRAKYSHACGHCCCWTCMKMEFARQRNIGRKKFYCHCGFEIHEKKIIRMFA